MGHSWSGRRGEMQGNNYAVGSIWRRWDPHIHAPGTVLANRYKPGDEGWVDFVRELQAASPSVVAIGVTDYYVLGSYEAARDRYLAGDLPNVELLFPNVELRLGVGTQKGSAVNIHLLVSPDDPHHVDELKRFLRELSFKAFDDTFRCEEADLRKLGREYRKSKGLDAGDDIAALAAGCEQFKVDFDELKTAWKRSEWVGNNVLLAVAGGSGDGTSGLSDGGLATQRAEIEKFADIIFSSQPKQREFWLGTGSASAQALNDRYGGRKPCLHGSDAHEAGRVAAPALDRFCWIKGDPTFEALKQACIEPTRAFIGENPPDQAVPSQTVRSITVTGAPWLKGLPVDLNPGLVCIIGARGSGKTALADIIASGTAAIMGEANTRSFLHRAKKHLRSSEVELRWGDEGETKQSLAEGGVADLWEDTRARYLSQQFVERLCAADGVTEDLLNEIQRVIFANYPADERLGAANFREMLDARAAAPRALRERLETELAEVSASLASERERGAAKAGLDKQRAAKIDALARADRDRAAISISGDRERLESLAKVTNAIEQIASSIEAASKKLEAAAQLQNAIHIYASRTAPQFAAELRSRHGAAGLTEEQWKLLTPGFPDEVAGVLTRQIDGAKAEVARLRGTTPTPVGDPKVDSYLEPDRSFTSYSSAVLTAEQKRLQDLIGLDRAQSRRLQELTSQIERDKAAVRKLDEAIALSLEAPAKIKELRERRQALYREIFDAIIQEEEALAELYAPLQARLLGETGSLSKLNFAVRRSADLHKWCEAGKELLDLRRGAFRGEDALANAAKEMLVPAWEAEESAAVAAAMAAFLAKYQDGIMEQSTAEKGDKDALRSWTGQVSEWLYSTGHIRVSYSLQFDGVDIEQLSPGTRGIVLLLLYLSVDLDDPRPLIIDQPEENLDPKSIYQELVGRFLEAKQRRQIIIVTHNANLVVNTDADQVIVASCGPQQPDTMPDITYLAGGLENAAIRGEVCEILEGGEDAFRDRALRLRLRKAH